MIEVPVKLGELLVRLLESRRGRRERHFDVVTRELFELSKQTYNDFHNILNEARNLIRSDADSERIKSFLERRRLDRKQDRDHMRTLVSSVETNNLSLFEYAVLDLLSGESAHFLRSLIVVIEGNMTSFSLSERNSRSNQKSRERAEGAIDRALEILEFDWQALNSSYQSQVRKYVRG